MQSRLAEVRLGPREGCCVLIEGVELFYEQAATRRCDPVDKRK